MKKRLHFSDPKFTIACSVQPKTDSFQKTSDWMEVTCKRCLKKKPTYQGEMAKALSCAIDSQIIKEMNL